MDILGKRDWGLKLLSAALAVVLWVYVSNELNPTKEQEYKNLAVDIRGVRSNLAVSQLPGTVNVRVAANQSILAELTSKSIEVYIDLKNVKTGLNNVPVKIRVPSGVKIVDYRPSSVQVTLEPVAEKQVPVIIRSVGSLASGYKVLSTEARPDEVILRGPQSILAKVHNTFIEIDLNGKNHSFSDVIPIRLEDGAGDNYDEGLIKREPQEVKVFTSVVPDLPTKTVRVVPKITGDPAPGYMINMTVVDPPELVITGQQKIIDAIKDVYTMPVKIDGAKQDVFAEAAPNLPSGVTGGRQLVNVLVKVGKE